MNSSDRHQETRSEKTVCSILGESNCGLEGEVGHWNVKVVIDMKANKAKRINRKEGSVKGSTEVLNVNG